MASTTKTIEYGVQNVIYYPYAEGTENGFTDGIDWKGVTSISVTFEGGEPTTLYADNNIYCQMVSNVQVKGSIEAYNTPGRFLASDGIEDLFGVQLHQQTRDIFSLSWVSFVQNATDNTKKRRLHILYNCIASPADTQYQTINESVDPMTRTWNISTTPYEKTPFDYIQYKYGYPITQTSYVELDVEDTPVVQEEDGKLRILNAVANKQFLTPREIINYWADGDFGIVDGTLSLEPDDNAQIDWRNTWWATPDNYPSEANGIVFYSRRAALNFKIHSYDKNGDDMDEFGADCMFQTSSTGAANNWTTKAVSTTAPMSITGSTLTYDLYAGEFIRAMSGTLAKEGDQHHMGGTWTSDIMLLPPKVQWESGYSEITEVNTDWYQYQTSQSDIVYELPDLYDGYSPIWEGASEGCRGLMMDSGTISSTNATHFTAINKTTDELVTIALSTYFVTDSSARTEADTAYVTSTNGYKFLVVPYYNEYGMMYMGFEFKSTTLRDTFFNTYKQAIFEFYSPAARVMDYSVPFNKDYGAARYAKCIVTLHDGYAPGNEEKNTENETIKEDNK